MTRGIGRLTFRIILKVLDQDVLYRRGLEGEDQTVTNDLSGEGETLFRKPLDPLELIAIGASLDIVVCDIHHKKLGLETGNCLAAWRPLLGSHASEPEVKDGGQGKHGHGRVGLATLDQGPLALAQECEDVGDSRCRDGCYL